MVIATGGAFYLSKEDTQVAEDLLTADVGAEGAPASPSSEPADHPAEMQYLTREEFEDRFAGGINWLASHTQEVVDRAFRGNQSNFDRAVSQIADKLGVSQERANTILGELAAENLGVERVAALEEKVAAKTAADATGARTKALEAELAAERAAKVSQPSHHDQVVVQALWSSATDRLDEFASEQGVGTDAKSHILKVMKNSFPPNDVGQPSIPPQRDPGAYVGIIKRFEADVRSSIKAAAEVTLREKEHATPALDTSIGAGGGGNPLTNYQKALRDGKALPSRAEIDKITAGFR